MELKVSGLQKTYKGVDGEPNFSLNLPEMRFELGKIIFVMGHNGSGKSVLTKLLAGEVLPSQGYINFTLDKEHWKAHERPSAIVRQNAEESLAMDLTVRENLLLRTQPTSIIDCLIPAIRLNSQVNNFVKSHAELHRKLDQPCRNLSGGQRQTLAFLAVAAKNFPILFLDEFLSATDRNTSCLLRNLARDYTRCVPACVFIVSHEPSIALADADRILILNRGHLLHDLSRGDPEWNEESLIRVLTYGSLK
jgi:ABC-type uncharacterized transport system ATPase component